MFAKLLLAILVTAATASMLLVSRQVRLETAHEMARLHTRLAESQRGLWELRGRIAERCRPDRLRRAMDQLGGDWVPVQWNWQGTEALREKILMSHGARITTPSLRASVP